ncbi:hypothetical protein ACFLZY_01495 [Patescibacteria group bacterium]
MKKQALYLIPSIALIFVSSYIFLVGLAVGREGGNHYPWLGIFVVFILLNFFYYLWLALTKRINNKWIIFYVPVALFLFIAFNFLMMYPPWLKNVSFNLGPDPFYNGTTITGGGTFLIWEKEFWSESAREEHRLNYIKHMQTARQGSLIGHVGTNLQGWSEEKIRTAFGEPAKIDRLTDGLEIWIYHPWTNHPDWEMPVYVKNGVLLRIGD